MAWVKIKPENSGGGRKQSAPAGKLYASGQLTINHAAVELLGSPDRITVEADYAARRIRMMPTTPTDKGSFSLAGGGNAQHRITARALLKEGMVGDYAVSRIAGGIELRKVEVHDD